MKLAVRIPAVLLLLLLASCRIDNMWPTKHTRQYCDGTAIPQDPSARFCQTDNRALTYYFGNTVTAPARDSVRATMSKSYGNTVLEPSYDSTPSFSGGSETDIIYQQVELPRDTRGHTWCENSVKGTRKCDQHYTQFNLDSIRSIDVRAACHETGHAVGLLHGPQADPSVYEQDGRLACMRVPGDSSVWYLDETNIGNINATY